MTRKQYKAKMRQLYRNFNREAKKNGTKPLAKADRIGYPNWGSIIKAGPHEGEKLVSYQQAWNTISSLLKDTPFMNGIEV